MKQQLEFMLENHPDILKGEPPHIVVKFNKRMKMDYEKPVDEQFLANKFEGWQKIQQNYLGTRLVPHYTAVSPKELGLLLEKAKQLDETYRPADFFSYFRIEHDDPSTLLQMLAEVKSWKAQIDNAFFYVPAPSPTVNPDDDPRSGNQNYLNPAPEGIDARYAWTVPGGDGAGMALVDIERGWTFTHQDLIVHGISLIHGEILDSERWHGTSVLGEICAADNTTGCAGIVPNLALVRGSSNHSSTWPNAIIAAINILSFGDVILLEAQDWVPGMPMMLGPIELNDDVYEAIRLATALGIIVVEAGGNGTDNGSAPPFALDTYINAAGNAIFNPRARSFRDSGAIIVSAASAAVPHTRLPFAPHGRRIDCYAWGENINTLNADSSGSTDLYTTWFGGTSGASAIIAGAALAVQGIAEANHHLRLSPRQMRAILRDPANGTAPAATESTRINVMPNLRHIIDNVLRVVPDIYIRDFPGIFEDTATGAISLSPDIIVRSEPVANPYMAFGQGSGTEDNISLSDMVTTGADHSIYVRMRNTGGATAYSATATVYWSPVASLVTPNLWNLIGTTTPFNVPMGNQLVVSPALTWPSSNIPAAGHYCFVALANHVLDPAPGLANFGVWDNFVNYVRFNNNVAWRNFNVVAEAPSPSTEPEAYYDLPFLLIGAMDKARPFDMDIQAGLPEGAKLFFEFPADLHKQLKRAFPHANLIKETGNFRAQLNPFKAAYMPALKLKAQYQGNCRILVFIPKALRDKQYMVRLRQFFKKTQVGGIAWQLGG